MRFVLGSDADHPLVDEVERVLGERGEVERLDPTAWPDAGRGVADAVAAGRADLGVVACWTGTGVSIAANKVAGVRAALCDDAYIANGARRWNDANVLALSMRSTSVAMAAEIVTAFLDGAVDPAELPNIERVE